MTRTSKITGLVACGALVGLGIYLAAHSGNGTEGQRFNAAIDNLLAAGNRVLELPLFMLLTGAALLAGAIALPLMRWGSKSGRITFTRTASAVVAGVLLFGLALLADHKIGALQDEVARLQKTINAERMAGDAAAVPATDPVTVAVATAPSDPPATTRGTTTRSTTGSAVTKPLAVTSPATARSGGPATSRVVKAAPSRTSYLIDTAKVQRNLALVFGPVGFHPIIHDQATDVVEVDIQNLPVVAYMAVVNLRTPGLEIKFGGSLTQKTLTTDFARANNCQIAINGEAGLSPRANSGFGVWHGNMVSAGQVMMKEDPSDKRPFLSFDRQNNVTFTALAAADRAVAPNSFNVIWGRLDAIIAGAVQTENERDRQPRTAMGISKDATKLFLMVVDGRQPRLSVGFTRQDVGTFLQVFGADNGMLCDEGGSSCIYVKKFNRILNSPSDGTERATYTHFGISLTPQ
jgi:hypothetical protein